MSRKLFNLLLAEAAVKYVGSKMTIGATNKPIDVSRARDRNIDLTDKLLNTDRALARADMDAAREKAKTSGEKFDMLPVVLGNAVRTEASGMGNCGEQATVAFAWLYNKGTRNIALAKLGTNHEFVVIGLKSPGAANLPIGPALPAAFNDVAFCDPWYHEWFTADTGEFPRKIRSILAQTEPTNTSNTVRLAVVIWV